MNVVKEIQSINAKELEMGSKGSWHDQYKDSAYIFVGGLHNGLTEGDVVTIFSQYGEIVDVNLPRDKETGKIKGFGFLMYEDQRSTVLAVDNLNGAKVLDRVLRVDHVADYKQKKKRNDDGTWEEPEEPSMNVKPELIRDDAGSGDEGSVSSAPSIDPEDPMRDYLLAKRKEEKGKQKSKKSKKHEGETPEERRARKERKRAKREAKARAVAGERGDTNSRSHHHRSHSRSRSPPPKSRRRDDDDDRYRDGSYHRRDTDDRRERSSRHYD
ncbi:hypothetical protein FRB99_008017 [Tulasnella sp. 403]|nr:hypothetical protein FRB99_008017 [Tulasnella sp. 403]